MKRKRGIKIRKSKKANSRSYLAYNKKLMPKSKRSQEIFGLSFGMIFAMVLIVFFVVMAIIVIISFLNMQKCAKIGIFIKDLNEKIENAWNQGDATFEFKGFLPTEIQYACFVNLTEGEPIRGRNSNIGTVLKTYSKKNNFYFYPPKQSCDLAGQKILHIDIPSITESENPYCIKNDRGKVSMNINMGDNGPFVMITR